MLPMAVVMLIVAPLAPRLVERFGTKLVVGAGLLLVAAGLGARLGRARHRRLPRSCSSPCVILSPAAWASTMAPGHRVDHGLAAARPRPASARP